jgi:hypothetical protein
MAILFKLCAKGNAAFWFFNNTMPSAAAVRAIVA